MHKSRIAGFIIDCQTTDLPAAAQFWSAALGMPIRPLPGTDPEKYVQLMDPLEELDVEVQSVDHASRVHLDIETDDVEAEVQRLVALGARRVEPIKTWWVLEAPTGQRFCVIRANTVRFEERANVWGSAD